jgi:hypothetical protein
MKIKIKRTKSIILRPLKIYADKTFLCKLGIKKSEKEVEVPDGANLIYGKIDWGKTDSVSAGDLHEGSTVVFEPYRSLNIIKTSGIKSLPVKVKIE